jgi:hypothetical protein
VNTAAEFAGGRWESSRDRRAGPDGDGSEVLIWVLEKKQGGLCLAGRPGEFVGRGLDWAYSGSATANC